MFGLFGDLFDFNHDGKLDGFEQAAEFAMFMNILDEEEKQRAMEEDLDLDEEDDWF